MTFEVQLHEPDLWTHLVRYEIQPLRLVFRWIMRGFSGHLQVIILIRALGADWEGTISTHIFDGVNTVSLPLCEPPVQPEQLLYLWDLLLAYDTMEVFPLLASTVLRY